MGPSIPIPSCPSSRGVEGIFRVSGAESPGLHAFCTKKRGPHSGGCQVIGYCARHHGTIHDGLVDTMMATWLAHADLFSVPSRYRRAASLITRAAGQSPAPPDLDGATGGAGGVGEDTRGVLKALSRFKASGKIAPSPSAAPGEEEAGIETELYSLKWRELVSMVAEREGVSVELLRKLNPGVDLDNVRSKQQIVIPKQKDVDTAILCPTRSDSPATPPAPAAAPSPESEPPLCPSPVPHSDLTTADIASDKGSKEGGLGAAVASVVRKLKGFNSSLEAPLAAPPSPPVETAEYQFRRGDKLSTLSAEWGLSEDEVVLLNPALSLDTIQAGTIILVPKDRMYSAQWDQGGARCEPGELGVRTEEDGSRSYMIQPADYLPGIARRYGVSVDEIMEANGLVEEERIRVGQVLTIPEPKEDTRLLSAQVAASDSPKFCGVPTRTVQALTFTSVVVAFATGGWLIARAKSSEERRRRTPSGPQQPVKRIRRGGQDLATYLDLPPDSVSSQGQVAGTCGWGEGRTLEVALEEAFVGATEVGEVEGCSADFIIAKAGGACFPSDVDGTSDSSHSLSWALGFLEQKVEGGGRVLGVAASTGGEEEETLCSGSVLLLQTSGGMAVTCSVGVREGETVEAAVQKAGERLQKEVGGGGCGWRWDRGLERGGMVDSGMLTDSVLGSSG